MVTREEHDRAMATREAAAELLAWSEKLLEQVILEVPVEHFPARRKLALWDPVASNGGSQLPFKSYQKAIEQVLQGRDQLFGVSFKQESDAANDGFRSVVDQLKMHGMSEPDAVGAASGSLNLDTLVEGMIPALLAFFKKALPALPIGGALGEAAGPISDFMAAGSPDESIAGNPSLAFVAHDFAQRVKNIAKTSVGIQAAAMREQESAPQAVISYAMGVAANKTVEFHPARIWHVWACYPNLRRVEAQARQLTTETISPVITGENKRMLDYMDDALREVATMFSSTPASQSLCCLIAIIAKNPTARLIIDQLRQTLKLAQSLNAPDINLQLPTMGDMATSFKTQMAGQLLRTIDEKFTELASNLRASWRKINSVPCLALDSLFDAVIKTLANLRLKLGQVLLHWVDSLKVHRRSEKAFNLRLMDQLSIGWNIETLDGIEGVIDWVTRCGMNGDRRFADIAARLAQDNGFKVHRRGQPIPAGANPLSPLLNLDPIETPNGFVVEPGIQGDSLPIGELAELFKSCKTREVSEAEPWVRLPAMIRRQA